MKTIIVGGVAGGASAAARLRRLDEQAEIIMLERGEYISFANCGLPYYIGGAITEQAALTLQTPASFKKRFNIDVRICSEVLSIDPAKKTVTVRDIKNNHEYQEGYDKLILAPGAEPIRPNIEGINNEKVFVLRNIPDTYRLKNYIEEQQPKTVAVIGGGYIGVEMAENLAEAGLTVTLVELADHLIAPLDVDMAADVHNYLRSKGVYMVLGNGVLAIEDKGSSLQLQLTAGTITAEMVLLAVGVKPESKIAREAGLAVNARGSIVVNEYMETSAPDIYAVGDAVEVVDFISGDKAFIPLAGPANRQGRIAADNICGLKSSYKKTQGSAILKIFAMTVATTGINERVAQAKGLNYDKVFTYSASHATYYPGASNMSIKTIFEKTTGRILGAQIVGYDGVDKRADVLATAIRNGLTAYDLTELELCYAPPFSSAKDPVNMVGFVIENILQGKVQNFHWHDIEELQKNKALTLLDVRTKQEHSAGKIDGFINIPLDELREHLSELDKSKPIYVHCFSGLRSYLACRILSGQGFKAYNLSGGYRLYSSIKKGWA